jgi:hypothetical protein
LSRRTARKQLIPDFFVEARFPVPSAEQVTGIVSESADVAGAAIKPQLFNALARLARE